MIRQILPNDDNIFTDVAHKSLVTYGLSQYALTFIRHSDTVTYKVETPGLGTYLLRIHIPVTSSMGSHGSDIQMITSELLWLEALKQDTDLVLQKPVRNLDDDLVTTVTVKETPLSVNCTLLSWVKGQPYHHDLETEQTAYQIGEIIATLHNHASHWDFPDGFTRPKRDILYFTKMLQGHEPAVRDGRVSPTDYAEFKQSISLLNTMMSDLEETRETHGLMHADTHKGNMLLNEGQIRLIDFSFCAIGHFMFDLGVCLSDMKPHLHPSFLQGYQSLKELPDNYQRWVEGFFVGSIVGIFSFWVDNPNTQELLTRKYSQIAREFAAKFNQGEYFWFT